jgi:transposase
MQLGYRYRIYPTADQAEALLAQMDRCRWVWNQARALREQAWRTERRTVGSRRWKWCNGVRGKSGVGDDAGHRGLRD